MHDLRAAANGHTAREHVQRAGPISWGSSGRRFKSCQPDKEKPALTYVGAVFLLSGCGWFWRIECPSGPRMSQGIQLVGRASARLTPLPADLAGLAAECEAVARGGSPLARDRPPSMGVG